MPITLLHIRVAMIHLILTMVQSAYKTSGQRQAGGKSQPNRTVTVQLQASPEELVEVHTLHLDRPTSHR